MTSHAQPSASNPQLLHSGPADSAYNMALDEALLEAMPRLQSPVLRFYSWTEPAASFGYFQRYADVERLTSLRPLVRRPTAGGIVPHNADWTYCLAFPINSDWYALKAVESYRRVHAWLQAAFAQLQVVTELAPTALMSGPGQCFAGYEQSDLLWHGRKIAGAAQRRNRDGLLIQGSVQPPPLSLSRTDWEKAMRAAAPFPQPVSWTECVLDHLLQARVDHLVREKYSQPAWNRRR